MKIRTALAAAALLAATYAADAETGAVSTGAAVSETGAQSSTGASVDPAPDFSAAAPADGSGAAAPSPDVQTAQAAEPAACTMEYAPVCGKDGKTYANACVAKSAGHADAAAGECAAKAAPAAPAAALPAPAITRYMNLGDNNKQVAAVQAYLKASGYYAGQVGTAYDEALGGAINAFLAAKTKAKWSGGEVAEPKKYAALQKALQADAAANRWNAHKAKRDALYRQIDDLNKRRAAAFQANKAAFKAIDDERKAAAAEYARKLAENKAKFQAALKAQAAAKAAAQKEYDAIIAQVKAADAAYRAGK